MQLNTPTVENRQKDWEALVADERQLLLNKGADYTAGKKNVDAYANFRIIADLLKGAPVTPYTVALIYALKHVLSLVTFAKTGKQESGEGLRGRHMDARNYLFILNELVPDHVNHFDNELMDWMGEENEINRKLREAGAGTIPPDTLFSCRREDDYGFLITEDVVTGTAKYFEDSTGEWRPLSDLDDKKQKEVNTTHCCPGGNLDPPFVEIGDLRNKR